MPDGMIKTKVKCNGINQNNMKFRNTFNAEEILTELNYEIFEEFYLNSIDHTLNKRKFIINNLQLKKIKLIVFNLFMELQVKINIWMKTN